MTLFRSREMRVFWIFAGALMVEDIRDLMMTIYIGTYMESKRTVLLL